MSHTIKAFVVLSLAVLVAGCAAEEEMAMEEPMVMEEPHMGKM